MRKILVICFSNLARDPRVYRQLQSLKDSYDLTAAGYNNPNIPNVKFIQISPKAPNKLVEKLQLKLSLYEKYFWQDALIEAKNELLKEKYDLIIANDYNCLPLAFAAAGNAKVIFDAHEYSPREYEGSFEWRFFKQDYVKYICGKYIPKVDEMLTVCDRIAKEYHENYDKLPTIHMNICDYQDLKPTETDNRIKIVYHGGLRHNMPDDYLELMNNLDERFTLDIIAITHQDKIKKIMKKNSRIRLVPPVRMVDIVPFTNKYDIGLYMLKPRSFNDECTLPNKFFEYIQARLMIAVNSLPEIVKIMDKYECGIISSMCDPKEMAAILNNLTKEDIMAYKQKSHLAAQELNFEKNSIILKDIVKKLIG